MAAKFLPDSGVGRLGVFLLCLLFCAVGAITGVRSARSCTTEYSYGSTTYIEEFEGCMCDDNGGICVEVGCSNDDACGESNPASIGCSVPGDCDVECDTCVAPANP
jgi:hypothetical protein